VISYRHRHLDRRRNRPGLRCHQPAEFQTAAPVGSPMRRGCTRLWTRIRLPPRWGARCTTAASVSTRSRCDRLIDRAPAITSITGAQLCLLSRNAGRRKLASASDRADGRTWPISLKNSRASFRGVFGGLRPYHWAIVDPSHSEGRVLRRSALSTAESEFFQRNRPNPAPHGATNGQATEQLLRNELTRAPTPCRLSDRSERTS